MSYCEIGRGQGGIYHRDAGRLIKKACVAKFGGVRVNGTKKKTDPLILSEFCF